jgi:ActR/RegA family two-component response regulator
MPSRKRVLFVDDEPSIRLTLPPVLEEHGFEVTSAGTVADALLEINSSNFDVLLSDLNIGEEGDGFLVVSAMRHVQPRCLTVILTGYPAFETALQAIRHQVDDYLVKPADIEALVNSLRDKLSKAEGNGTQRKRLSPMLREKLNDITRQVLQIMRRDPEFSRARANDEALAGRIPDILSVVIKLLERGAEDPAGEDIRVAAEHGQLRRLQGYRALTIANDFEILEMQVYDVVQSNLIGLDTTGLIVDLRRAQQILSGLMKQALAAYEETALKRSTA